MPVIKSQFTLRLNPETHAKLKKIAVAEKRSVTNLIEYTLEKTIVLYEQEHGVIPLSDDDIFLK